MLHHEASLFDSEGVPHHIRYAVRPGQELTWREREVVAQVLRGVTNKEIAKALALSEKTIKFHLSRIYKKLKVESRGQLILRECGRI